MSLGDYLDGPRVGSGGWDVVGATFVLVVTLVLLPLRFFVSQYFIQAIPIVLGVASGGYLLLERYGVDGAERRQWRMAPYTGHVLAMTVLVGLAAMVLVGVATGGRTVPFFGVAAVVGALVFLQIFFLPRSALDPGPILAQVVAYAVVVRWIALLTTPGLIGVDAWIHVPNYAASIQQEGTLWAISHSKYFSAPLYHLLVVGAAQALGTSLRVALYATLGLVMPLSVVLAYYTGRLVLPLRWALFAAATFAVADHVVRWGIHLIPTSMGLAFFLAIVYGVAKIYRTGGSLARYGLVVVLVVATILTHQISTFVVLVFLGVGSAVQLYARFLDPWIALVDVTRDDGHLNFLVLFGLAVPLTAFGWSLAPRGEGSFLTGMLESALLALQSPGFLALESVSTVDFTPIESLLVSLPLSIKVLDSLGLLLLLLVALVGSFALLRSDVLEVLSLSWLGSTGVMLFVVFAMPIFGLYFLIPMRWYAFLYVPMVLLAAYGMDHLEVTMPARAMVAGLVVFALVFPGAMLVNHKASHDDPIADDYYATFAFSESELEAADTIATLHPSEEERLQTDNPYFLYFRNAKRMTPEAIELNDRGIVTGDHVVARDRQTTHGVKAEYRGENVRVELPPDAVCRPDMNVRYSNGDVQYCTTPS